MQPVGDQAVVSLFSGAGGLDLGVKAAGLEVAVATDYEEKALATLRANAPVVPTIAGDIREVATGELLDAARLEVGDAALVVGGPPCTPFSKSGFWRKEKVESRDPNASLLDEYVRVVREAQPAGFVLENVQALTYKNHAVQFTRLLDGLSSAGYSVDHKVLLAADHGVPQLRRRTFVIGRRDGGPLSFPVATHSGWSERDLTIDANLPGHITAKDAIGDLLPGIPEKGDVANGTWAEHLAEVPAGENYLWHTERGGGRGEWEWRSRYWTFLLRLDPNRPSTTIQAQPGPWVGPFHWENVETQAGPRARRLRVPELLRFMTFPDDYRFADGTARRDAQRQLGNAVPVELARRVVATLAADLQLF